MSPDTDSHDLFSQLFDDEDATQSKKTAAKTAASKSVKEATPDTVTALTRRIRRTLEGTVGRVWVEGEISNFHAHRSGHWYFSLKDEESRINALMFRSKADRMKFMPENGMQVVVRGTLSVYPPQGQYQVVCDSIQPSGVGALQQAFEQLKKTLAAAGLFDENRKKTLPAFPRVIGVVTSPGGAAIRDIIHVLFRRFPHARVLVNPAPVQGDQAAPLIARAIREFNELNTMHDNNPRSTPWHVDVIIAGRGGGSMEDLWAFNEECVARAIADSDLPVISAVGHETDWCIADFVADVRAPTPSAAAEIVIASRTEWEQRLRGYVRRMQGEIIPRVSMLQRRVDALQSHYALREPQRYIQDFRQHVDDLASRLHRHIDTTTREAGTRVNDARHVLRAAHRIFAAQLLYQRDRHATHTASLVRAGADMLHSRRTALTTLLRTLENVGPTAVLQRGYTITRDTTRDTPLTCATDVTKDQHLLTEFHDGSVLSRVEKIVPRDT